MSSPDSVGIVGIEYQLPCYKVDEEEVAKYLGWEVDKIKIGLGMFEVGALGYTEDIVSLALGAVYRLIKRYNVDPKDVGKIEVGTESHFDSAKSVKTYLLDLFPNNMSISGCDTINACYGGTNALLNSLAWMESSFCSHKYAIVVCTDVSVYDDMAAIPTSGGGAVAMLIGKDPVFKFMGDTLFTYSSNEGDFCKPKPLYFPYIDGPKSVAVYKTAFEAVYSKYIQKFGESFDYISLHSPFPKLVVKTCKAANIDPKKYEGSVMASRYNGNTYTASLYYAFISTLFTKNVQVNDVIALYSFGSGCVASIFCLQKVKEGMEIDDLEQRLMDRKRISFSTYQDIIKNMSEYKVNFDKKEESDRFCIYDVVDCMRKYRNLNN